MLVFVLAGTLSASQAQSPASAVVINEIHYDPHIKTEHTEFIELYNRSDTPVNLSSWAIDGAVEYLIPDGTILAPDRYLVIAQSPSDIQNRYGTFAFGPFFGKLGNEGELITLRDENAALVDSVTYGIGFPWPTVGDAPGNSIGLIHPDLENEQAAHWRSGLPSPGAINTVYATASPPRIHQVNHRPLRPRSNETVFVHAQVSDPDGVGEVQLLYQLVNPGQYIALDDPAYETDWTPLPMNDAGVDGDLLGGDGVYTGRISSDLHQHRQLVRYRIRAADPSGQVILAPYADDPQPNFAYFVYDDIPTWQGAIDPDSADENSLTTTYDFNALHPLPIYHFIANGADVADAQFIPPSSLGSGYTGNGYPWYGTLVYDDVVYDHISFRARGGSHRYHMGKNMWKFDFTRGHYFQAYDREGTPYPVKWDKLNFSAIIQQGNFGHRGEQGLFESVGFKLFNMMSVPAPDTYYVHFRVIDAADEGGETQYDSDFWGLYLVIEQMDGRFLDHHGLPDGNLYKMEEEQGLTELNNQGPTAPTNRSDLNAFLGAIVGDLGDQWWREHFDLDGYYRYRAVLEAIHHYDVHRGKNYFYYINPETNVWSVFPWDIDLSWDDEMFGNGAEPFRDVILTRETFEIEYQNQMREVLDLLYNPDQMFRLINDFASDVFDTSGGPSFVDADRAMWDYNPILISRYIDLKYADHGRFYQINASEDFAGMIRRMRNYVVSRSRWIEEEILTDVDMPETPSVTYSGPANHPVDRLTFQTSIFRDPQGNDSFSAMEWRVAEVTNPNSPAYDPDAPLLYEIDALWKSGEQTTFEPTIQIPPGSTQPGHTYRVRVRMKDNTGRWSHWSTPVQFITTAPTEPPTTDLQFTEIMYHPLNVGGFPSNEFEFIELTNRGQESVSLANMQFTEGINYTFPADAVLAPGELLVLANDRSHFTRQYGLNPYDTYRGNLSNAGEQLTLSDAYGRTVLSLSYDDASPWASVADGSGFSLVPVDPTNLLADLNNPENWRSSTNIGGSPSLIDPPSTDVAPPAIVINEILAHTDLPQRDAIELYNPTTQPINVSGWYLSDSAASPRKFQLPNNSVIPADGYLLFDETDFNATPDAPTSFALDSHGETVYLFAVDPLGNLTGSFHAIEFGASENGISFGRYTDSTGAVHYPAQNQLTLGEPNAGPLIGPVVIAELLYHPQTGHEFVELLNRTNSAVKLYDSAHPANTWRLEGVSYQMPTGVEIPAGDTLLIVPIEPQQFRALYGVPDDIQIFGPYAGGLPDTGGSIRLLKPDRPDADGTIPSIIVDEISYQNEAPWPTEPAGTGPSLERVSSSAYGNDPSSWQASSQLGGSTGPTPTPVPTPTPIPGAKVTNFNVTIAEDGQHYELRWETSGEVGVEGFHLWRHPQGERVNAELVTSQIILALGSSEGGSTDGGGNDTTYSEIDPTGQTYIGYTYWLEIVYNNGESEDVASIEAVPNEIRLYLPVIQR